MLFRVKLDQLLTRVTLINIMSTSQVSTIGPIENAAIQPATEALNPKKNEPTRIGHFKMFPPKNVWPEDPKNPRKEISELTKEELKHKIINIVGKKYINQLFQGTAIHKLKLEVTIPSMGSQYAKMIDLPTMKKIEELEIPNSGKKNQKYKNISLEQEIYVRYVEVLKILVDTVDDYLEDHWLSLEPLRLQEPSSDALFQVRECYEKAEATHQKLKKLYDAYRERCEPERYHWLPPKIWDGGNFKFTNFNESKVRIFKNYEIVKEPPVPIEAAVNWVPSSDNEHLSIDELDTINDEIISNESSDDTITQRLFKKLNLFKSKSKNKVDMNELDCCDESKQCAVNQLRISLEKQNELPNISSAFFQEEKLRKIRISGKKCKIYHKYYIPCNIWIRHIRLFHFPFNK